MADPDEATSALIAKMLQEQDSGYGAFNPTYDGMGFDDFDSEEEERPKKRRKAKGKKGGRKPSTKKKTPKPKPKAAKENDPGNAPAEGKQKRKIRNWSEEEEQLFLAGLEEYGRDWKKIAEKLNTGRDHKGIASHAQKHFIKLYSENKPLPDKVRESGEGYTLSGKPLDPESAAARAYGLKVRRGVALADLIEAGKLSPGKQKVIVKYQRKQYKADLIEDGTIEYDGKTYNSCSAFALDVKRQTTPNKKADDGWKSCLYNGKSLHDYKLDFLKDEEKDTGGKSKFFSDKSEEEGSADGTGAFSARAKNDELLAKARAEGTLTRQLLPGQSKTTRATGRREPESEEQKQAKLKEKEQIELKKELEKRKKKADEWKKKELEAAKHYDENGRTEYSRNRSRRKAATKFINASNELSFVPCAKYHGLPASGEPLSQPFEVFVHSNVYALVDLHSHLSTAEVMGFLAGTWNAEDRKLVVTGAYPGRSLVDGATECEMDPVVEVTLRAEIEAKGLKVVGWYHSHPTFEAIPSSCDIDNQCNYQALCRDMRSGVDPFIGLIDSPFDSRNVSTASRFSWFYVESPQTKKKGMHIETNLICDPSLPDGVKQRMHELAKTKDESSSKAVQFGEFWAEVPDIGPMNYSQKLEKSLEMWLPPQLFDLNKVSMKDLDIKEEETSSSIIKPLLQILN